MGYTILLFLVVVIGTVIVYLAMGKAADSDVQRVKDRLLGRTKVEKSKEGGGEAPALIKSDEPQASIAQKILNNLQLAERVQSLIEQAGLRWTSAKLMQLALLCAVGGFIFAWYMLPPPFDRFAWGLGLIGFFMPVMSVSRILRPPTVRSPPTSTDPMSEPSVITTVAPILASADATATTTPSPRLPQSSAVTARPAT